jgi:SecD/SecF fusion protein
VNVVAFLACMLMDKSMGGGSGLTDMFGLHFFLASDFHIYQLVTYMFMHGGFQHILFNMFALWMFGCVVERVWGPKKFLFYYIVCGVGAGLFQEAAQYITYVAKDMAAYDYVSVNGARITMEQYLNLWTTVGASGAIYAILLAFGMIYPNERLFIFPLPVPIKAKFFVIGYAVIELVSTFSLSAVAKRVLPSDLRLLWSAKPADNLKVKNIFELHALKVTTTTGRAPLEGDVITDAKDEFDQMGSPVVSMKMNTEGARKWAQMTKANVGKAIAIVLDGVVYSAPRVNGEIDGGSSQISGNFTIEDTKDLANTLKSGRMPAPARIVQEEVVGPTLGAQSIQMGIVSFVVAFVLLMVYMVMMYNIIPGMMANLALLVNVFFTLGILTSFQAALTLPGLAGMVLSLGTAVDANVLIYERIKEELRSGKGMKQAVAAGYGNAFSAIFDSNLTSLITGVILLTTGTGPIRGFATTWIIGIVVSFFTAVFLTRLVYDYKLNHDKWMHCKFDTPVSHNLMQGKKYKFMSMYKTTFTVAIVAAVVFIGSFFVRGLSKSIDFTGGRNYVVQFENPVEPEQIRTVLGDAFVNADGTKATTGAIAIGTDGKTIRVSTNYMIESNSPTVDDEAETILYNALKKANLVSQKSVEAFKNPDVRQGGSIISSTKVGPSVAKDITMGAIYSVLFALIAIFLYILIRFRKYLLFVILVCHTLL